MAEYIEKPDMQYNVGICIDCKYFREIQKREKYPHCTYMPEAMRLKSETIRCKKYERRTENDNL